MKINSKPQLESHSTYSPAKPRALIRSIKHLMTEALKQNSLPSSPRLAPSRVKLEITE